MVSLFGKSTTSKSPSEIVRNLKEALLIVNNNERKYEKAIEDVNKYVTYAKLIICGHEGHPINKDHVQELAYSIFELDVLILLINNLSRIEFECRKEVVSIFSNLLRRQIGSSFPTVDYMCLRTDLLFTLLLGYERGEMALSCGQMLKEAIRHERLARIILFHHSFYNLFEYSQASSFDIASDAFGTFKDIVTRHKSMCSSFLDMNYDVFFNEYRKLLESQNYVTKRQSIKLLGEILLDRHNFNVMTRFVSNADNLKTMMNLLRDKSQSIQFEAFHVFKVFVANPGKPRAICDILLRNQEKLVNFLIEFHTERNTDDQFNDEKAYLIKQIKELKTVT